MLIHSMLPRSAVNGPGERAVVWFQGCDLHCRGCFNPASHPFDRDRDLMAPRWRSTHVKVIAAREGGRLIGSNVATRWGSFGFFGP